MDTSDPQRPPAPDPSAADPEAAEAAEQPQAAAPVDAPPIPEPEPEPEAQPKLAPEAEPDPVLLPEEADSIERAHFEMLERETTQPVRPYAFDVPAAESAPPEPRSVPPLRYPGTEAARPAGFEPAPFAVPPPMDRPEPVVPHAAPLPTYVGPEPVAPPAPEPESAPELPPAPREDFAPSEAALPPEDVAPPPDLYAAPTPFADHRPQYDLRREPVFDRPAAPSLSVDADAAQTIDAPTTIAAQPIAAPPGRDWRDLVRRAASVAFLVFAGWFAAVLMLILVYRFIDPPFSMLMAQRFLTGTSIDKQWVPIERISPNLSRAVIVAEDGRFCQHWGIDFIEAANAIRRSSSGYPRGASTITMQVAKNLFLVPAKSYLRKIVEIPLTFAIELVWPKRRILEIYLNIVEWGPGVFGAEAASRAHFGRSASGLSARQAAQLAAVLPNPIVRDAGAPGPRTSHKASIIQARAARTREASACVDIRR